MSNVICYYCERKLPRTIDHIIAKALGGNENPKNRVNSCNECNALKGGLSLELLIIRLDEIINSKNKTAYRTEHQKLYLIIRNNVLLLIDKIEPYKHELLKGFRYKKDREHRVLFGIHKPPKKYLQETQTIEDILFLQYQTLDEFKERQNIKQPNGAS